MIKEVYHDQPMALVLDKNMIPFAVFSKQKDAFWYLASLEGFSLRPLEFHDIDKNTTALVYKSPNGDKLLGYTRFPVYFEPEHIAY